MSLVHHRRRPGPGRPRLAPGRRRSCSIYLRLTDQELSLLRSRAESVGDTTATFARDLALYALTPAPCISRIDPAAIGRLTRIGNLCNEAIHRVNAGRLAPDLRSILEETYGVLADMLHSLETNSQ
jgi:hypothetical protein